MNMRRILSLVAFFATLQASAQQVNPVPDYVFANRMSAGRNTVTDTAAYFSIGPRYGATRGMMPPMVVDTASFSANKRNGLLIFSVQKNKFLYWDSVGVKWAEMAGTGGSAITGSGVAGYMPEFTTTTNIDTTSFYHSGGRFGLSTTSPERKLHVNDTISTKGLIIDTVGGLAYQLSRPSAPTGFLSAGTLGLRNRTNASGFLASMNFMTDRPNGDPMGSNNEGAQFLFIGKFRANQTGWETLDSAVYARYKVQFQYYTNNLPTGRHQFLSKDSLNVDQVFFDISPRDYLIQSNLPTDINARFRVPNSEIHIGSTTDYGVYSLQNTGAFYNTSSVQLAAITGNVGIGTVTPNTYSNYRTLSIAGSSTGAVIDMATSSGLISGGMQIAARATDADITAMGPQSGTSAFLTLRTGTFGSVGDRMRIFGNGRISVNSTTDAGYQFDVTGSIRTTTTITTGAPSGGSIKPWKIGEAATVSPTSPNRTIRVEIDGVVYYIHAKTTND